MKTILAVLSAITFIASVPGQSPPRPQTFDRMTTLPNRNPPKPASVAGIVLSESTGQPLSGAAVTLSRNYQNVLEALMEDTATREPDPVTTDDNGGFAFRDLPPGRFTLSVRRDGYLTQRSGAELVLESGQNRSDVTIRMPTSARLNGYVRNEAGQPIPGAPLFLLKAESFGRVANGQSDAVGAYSLQDFPPGNYTLVAGSPASLNGESAPSFTASISVTNTEARVMDLTLHGGAYAIRGKLNAPSGSVLPSDVNVSATIILPASNRPVTPSYNPSRGTFEIPDLLPGVYVINATVLESDARSLCGSIHAIVTRSDVSGLDLMLGQCKL